jgi:hypothetical protein
MKNSSTPPLYTNSAKTFQKHRIRNLAIFSCLLVAIIAGCLILGFQLRDLFIFLVLLCTTLISLTLIWTVATRNGLDRATYRMVLFCALLVGGSFFLFSLVGAFLGPSERFPSWIDKVIFAAFSGTLGAIFSGVVGLIFVMIKRAARGAKQR